MFPVTLFAPETVTVVSAAEVLDDLGERVSVTETQTEAEVLVQPGATADMDATRPEGITVAYTLHFPKTWTAPLRGCSCLVRGERCQVVGDPKPFTAANTPGEYSMPVEVTRADG